MIFLVLFEHDQCPLNIQLSKKTIFLSSGLLLDPFEDLSSVRQVSQKSISLQSISHSDIIQEYWGLRAILNHFLVVLVPLGRG